MSNITSHFRYSSVSDAHKCMKYYELRYLLGIPDGGDNSGDMRFGTAVHLGVEDILTNGNGVDVFTALWELEQDNKALVYGRHNGVALLTLGQSLLEIFRDEHAKHFIPSHLEKKLITQLGRHRFGGTIDFVGSFRKVPSVVDCKTSAMPYDRYKLIVNEQTYGYHYLAEKELGFTAEQVVYGVAIKDDKNPRWQFRKEPVTKEKRAEVLANIEAMCDRVADTKVFIKNPGACVIGKRVCPYFSRCYRSSGGASGGETGEEA